MVAWTVRSTEEGKLNIIVNGKVAEYGTILDISVPMEDEYKDEYIKVSLIWNLSYCVI